MIETVISQAIDTEDLMAASKAIHDAISDEVKSLVTSEVSKQLSSIIKRFEDARQEMKSMYEVKVTELEMILKSMPVPQVTVELPKVKMATKQIMKDPLTGERSLVKETYEYDR